LPLHHRRPPGITVASAGERAPPTLRALDPFLPFQRIERVVFQVALFSIVLTLAAAPEASLLCTLWCQPGGAATSGCNHHDQEPSTVVKSGDLCGIAALKVPGFIPAAGVRAAAGSDAHAVAVQRYQLNRPATQPGAAQGFERPPGLERRPLDTVLRL
jgi:hypothetical protein